MCGRPTSAKHQCKQQIHSSVQVEVSQATTLLKPADLQLLHGSSIAERVSLPTALESLSALIQQQESVEHQRSSLPTLQVPHSIEQYSILP